MNMNTEKAIVPTSRYVWIYCTYLLFPLIYVLLKDLPNSVNFWSVLHEHFVQGSGVNCYLVNINFEL